jgi:hypothetical protein
MQINPAIDNKRVICCHDTKMLTARPQNTDWASQNANVDAAVVASQPRPDGHAADQQDDGGRCLEHDLPVEQRPWASTKSGHEDEWDWFQHHEPSPGGDLQEAHRCAGGLGVQPSNIILYDACDNATTYYSPSMSLTDATKIRAVMSTRAANMGGFKAVT